MNYNYFRASNDNYNRNLSYVYIYSGVVTVKVGVLEGTALTTS